MDIKTLNEILEFVEAPYRVTSPIVESGQRKVYYAQDIHSSAQVVLKVCPLYPVMVARIKREIRILQEIDSKYFPKFFYEFFITDQELSYFVDSLDPKTQQHRLVEIAKMGIKPFLVTAEECIEHIHWDKCWENLRAEPVFITFLIHLFSGLKLLWDKKIVHRDLKPENILIRPNMEPVIIDLGIAKSMNKGATIITNPAFSSPCTPRFAAPEQLTNNKAEVTYKSDQFSVGVIAFLVLAGKLPYGSDEEVGMEGVIRNFFQGKIEDLRRHNSEISENFVLLIERLLKVVPYQRFRSVEEIISALTALEETK
ncbi:MAG TPA: serine/threonine-protein kinase [Pseudobdellovibrionaceae bacterium]|jgi:serine/threonine-protein kinase